jgi:hypothetical protein
MSKPKLHLDADASQKALLEALRKRGHDVTRTPAAGLPFDANDDDQLLWATAQGRIIFTHNIRDFIRKIALYPHHGGILLAHRSSYSLSEQIELMDRLLSETIAEEWVGQVRWLSDWLRDDSRAG